MNPLRQIIDRAHDYGAKVLVDGAQSSPHKHLNLDHLGCDFYAFSGHKIYGPSGIGILYGKYELLQAMCPYVTGGEMIEKVTLEKTSYAKPPARFEAGTPPISQMIGLARALKYIQDLGMSKIEQYEQALLDYGQRLLKDISGLRIVGQAKERASLISFILEDIHPHDVVTLLDQRRISVRGGHHCAQPLMNRLGIVGTTRASISFYNTTEEWDCLAEGIYQVKKVFKR